MDKKTDLQLAIECMRAKLHQLVANKNGNLADPDVADLSRQLDDLIVRHEQLKARQDRKRDT